MDLTDPLLFTCELHYVLALRVMLPNDYVETVSVNDTSLTRGLPAGFREVSLSMNTSVINELERNFFLTLSIANASLLDGGEIVCDDTTPMNSITAGCRVCGMFDYISRQKLL